MRSSTIFILASAALAAPSLAMGERLSAVRNPSYYRTNGLAARSYDEESGAAAKAPGRKTNWAQVASSVAGILPFIAPWLPTGDQSQQAQGQDQQQQQQAPQRRDFNEVIELIARAVEDDDESGAINWQEVANTAAGVLPHLVPFLPGHNNVAYAGGYYRRADDAVYELLARAVDELESGALDWQQVADTAAGVLPHVVPFLPDGTPKEPAEHVIRPQADRPRRSELNEIFARALLDELD